MTEDDILACSCCLLEISLVVVLTNTWLLFPREYLSWGGTEGSNQQNSTAFNICEWDLFQRLLSWTSVLPLIQFLDLLSSELWVESELEGLLIVGPILYPALLTERLLVSMLDQSLVVVIVFIDSVFHNIVIFPCNKPEKRTPSRYPGLTIG